ncbi:MAG: ABC transporter ATP-binding protein [Deltaproteobacteria bacterium]|nr:ABC transporter ATP-binding protein [Deltaproteobacteria bacterium]
MNLTHCFGKTRVLSQVSLEVPRGAWFACLGPNGSGKTTLFKILSTQLIPTEVEVLWMGGASLKNPNGIRQKIGVVFQHPSLDEKLTVFENLKYQGFLQGLEGHVLAVRIEALLKRVHLWDRKDTRIFELSGGLKRRCEIAKALLHQPSILLLDEPTQGLDPAIRKNIWSFLKELQAENQMTLLMTTHSTQEAESADRVIILNQGVCVAMDSPQNLIAQISGDILEIASADIEKLHRALEQKFSEKFEILNGKIRIEKLNSHQYLQDIMKDFHEQVSSATLSRPTLEDVFIQKTGAGFNAEGGAS